MRPGRVIEVLDSGLVKVAAPGLFSEEDKEVLPNVMPFFGWHANTYSEPKVDDEVWVLNFTDNSLQLFWFRKDNRAEHNAGIEGEENVEILCNREAGTGYATIYFSDGTGWMFRNGDSLMNIRADGTIILNTNGNTVLHVTDSGISLGTENKSAHPGCFGDETQKALQMISSCLKAIRQAAQPNAQTAAISAAIGSAPENLDSQADAIVSNKITLD